MKRTAKNDLKVQFLHATLEESTQIVISSHSFSLYMWSCR